MVLGIDPNIELWVLAPMGGTAAAVAVWRAAAWVRRRWEEARELPRDNPEKAAKGEAAPIRTAAAVAKPWPTKSGVTSDTRRRLPRKKLAEIMYGDKGVVTQGEREVHKLLLGVAGVLATVVCVLFILQLLPRVPPSDYLWALELASGPYGQYVRLAIPTLAGVVSAYLTVFKVFRVGSRRREA